MAWEGSTRRARLPRNWPALRKQRLEIDEYRCTWPLPSGARCPEPATDVDHLEEMADVDRIEALRSLCGPHHLQKTGRFAGSRSAKRRAVIAAKRFRPRERHPGLL